MAGVVNRVNEEITQWQEKEKELAKLFPEQVRNSKESLGNSLKYYRSILDKYKQTDDVNEKRSLIMVRALSRELENKLYPSLVDKLFRSIKDIVLPEKKQELIEEVNFRNELKLRDELSGQGFGNLQGEIAKGVRSNQPEFSIPLAWTVNGDRKINFNLYFQKNSAGEYAFTKYLASLQRGKDASTFVNQTFEVSEQVTPTQAFNLLSGRAVEKEQVTAEGEYYREWKQLDFNDRNASGNYKMTVIKHDKTFDVAGEIKELVDQGLIIAPSAKTIIDGISDGNNQYVLVKAHDGEKVAYIRADAQNRSLKFSNENLEPLTLLSLLRKEPVLTIAKEQERNISQERNQGLRM